MRTGREPPGDFLLHPFTGHGSSFATPARHARDTQVGPTRTVEEIGYSGTNRFSFFNF